mgnify:CR=1 FL=1
MATYSAKKIVQTAIDTINEKYGKVWYRRYNKFQNDGYAYNVGCYHDGIWSFDCLGFVHTMVNGFCGDTSKVGGGAVLGAAATFGGGKLWKWYKNRPRL